MADKDEVLWGVEAIAAEIGRDERAVYYMLSKGALPAARKVAGRWMVPRRRLWSFLNGEDQAV